MRSLLYISADEVLKKPEFHTGFMLRKLLQHYEIPIVTWAEACDISLEKARDIMNGEYDFVNDIEKFEDIVSYVKKKYAHLTRPIRIPYYPVNKDTMYETLEAVKHFVDNCQDRELFEQFATELGNISEELDWRYD